SDLITSKVDVVSSRPCESCADREAVLSAVPLAEVCNALVVRDQGTCKLDRRGDQQAICWIALLQMVKRIAARRCMQAQGRGFYAGTMQETVDPGRNREIEIDPLRVDEERNLPGCDGTHENGS